MDAAIISSNRLKMLEAEGIYIIREVLATFRRPVLLYSVGKDSSVLLHLLKKACSPGKPVIPLLHIDTLWKFREMIEFRDSEAARHGVEMLVYTNPHGVSAGVGPITHGSRVHTDIMKTQALKQALNRWGFDAAIGGARRDEDRARAKERFISFRGNFHQWDPKSQRPELWRSFHMRISPGESVRAFPLSNWTELDVWNYIRQEGIEVVPLYFASRRPVVEREGELIVVDDDRLDVSPSEEVLIKRVRFRTIGCYPLTGAIESDACDVNSIISEIVSLGTSERVGRLIDRDERGSMERKKKEGYF